MEDLLPTKEDFENKIREINLKRLEGRGKMENKIVRIMSTIMFVINLVILTVAFITRNPFWIGCSIGWPLGHILFLISYYRSKKN